MITTKTQTDKQLSSELSKLYNLVCFDACHPLGYRFLKFSIFLMSKIEACLLTFAGEMLERSKKRLVQLVLDVIKVEEAFLVKIPA